MSPVIAIVSPVIVVAAPVTLTTEPVIVTEPVVGSLEESSFPNKLTECPVISTAPLAVISCSSPDIVVLPVTFKIPWSTFFCPPEIVFILPEIEFEAAPAVPPE